MALDHGMLNLPLGKRGNFHKELDGHLKSEQKKKKAAFDAAKASNEEARKEAWNQYKLIDEVLLSAEAHRRGMKIRELREVVRSLCNDRPKAALKVLELFIPAA
ncbi:hypothetical protein FZI51_12555 [Cronobacter sakazakii]|uniref:hypothetical protein n=1 Tax=Cronobacter sakazakii TaxID=28141 RepID=UPI0013F881C6|nr:hypothetical protein [Cronobacter sakazakii]EJQ2008237.1 hypothetical protein [Cronobacter sakazakii]EJQ2088505.1 hypothetical protein [Cronobacter sakazakii]EJR9311724.1 hypothetical protein [Cronobacter sakazakii]EJR9316347.1 hypothetical protein [Cronobacter sakazakii]EJR9320880.1 hypothetical protein [Cronobacter sakazakii]